MRKNLEVDATGLAVHPDWPYIWQGFPVTSKFSQLLRYFLNHFESLRVHGKLGVLHSLAGKAVQRTEVVAVARRLSFMASSIALILAPRAGASR